MTTFVIATQYYEDSRLSIAANHDDLLSDEKTRFGLLQNRQPCVVGPMDDHGSNPWLGINEHGLFCGLTNRMGTYPNKVLRTRGQLVLDALMARTAEEAMERLKDIDAGTYNAFHLVLADTETAYCLWSDGFFVTAVELGHGIHVVTERSFGAASSDREDFLKEQVTGTKDVAELADVMGMHRENPFDSPCVHVPASNYGTRCSTLLEFHTTRGLAVMYADGSPCDVEYEDYSPAIRGMISFKADF
jgi:uncharacterized protein with NRDE domain